LSKIKEEKEESLISDSDKLEKSIIKKNHEIDILKMDFIEI
jgi:hypothetical protein